MKTAEHPAFRHRHHDLHGDVGARRASTAPINLGQGFPDTEGPADVVRAAADALLDHRNQYPPMTGLPELRQAVADAQRPLLGHRGRPATRGGRDVAARPRRWPTA